ncbi:unnamed protein product [Phaedon cochleariae]|uniref:Sorbin and SH3 domain-containing protein 1 n=1 Tax=Phaedon cochleariae TaxID=80249 RepID=A0A9P0GQJ3_PHACE|nr:unnamed protein product [Phaedon cochleariae]
MTTRRDAVLEGGAPWGFRMHGGVDQNQPLKISRVNPGSKAAIRGIREGDLISSINGRRTNNLTNLEAHGLLKSAGSNLKLGLNEDTSDSPRRRQYRTVHQETLEETVKRSSITTYSVEKILETVEPTNENKENSASISNERIIQQNGTSKGLPASDILVTKRPKVPTSSSSSSPSVIKEGDLQYSSADNAEASQRSYYTNCTLSPSSPSILSEDGKSSCHQESQQKHKHNNKHNMNDNAVSSRSKKRRQRRKNRKINENITEIQTITNTCDKDCSYPDVAAKKVKEEYVVHSPGEFSRKITKPVKSKSLDDDDLLKIQELSEASESEDKGKETNPIVSEASESEAEWDGTFDLATPATLQGTLSTLTLPLEGYSTEQSTLISPEEEETLRNFLESLHLVSGPEEAANQTSYVIDDVKQRKARKKADLELYFLPICQNPRYLDVISEETSDLDSDREQPSLTKNLKQGTPELEEPPPRLNRERKKALPKRFPPAMEQSPAILVDTKIIDTSPQTDGVFTAVKTKEATESIAEVVYLTSSETDSSEEIDSMESDKSDFERAIIPKAISEPTRMIEINSDRNYEMNNESIIHEASSVNRETLDEEHSSRYCFEVKRHITYSDVDKNIAENCLLSQLTPPPTPENLSPKYKNTVQDYREANEVNTIEKLADESEESLDTNIYSYGISLHSDTPVICSDVVSTPPLPTKSSSSSRSSSRGSSLCTAMYNPSNSSITDVTSLLKEGDNSKYTQPLTLRELCLKFLLRLPFGREVLQELAEVSKRIDSYTSSLPSTVLPEIVPNIAQSVNRANADANNLSYHLSVQNPQNHLSVDKKQVKEGPVYKEWKEAKLDSNYVDRSGIIRSLDFPVVSDGAEIQITTPVRVHFDKEDKHSYQEQETDLPVASTHNTESVEKKEFVISIRKDWKVEERKNPSEIEANGIAKETEVDKKEWVGSKKSINTNSKMSLSRENHKPVSGEWIGLANEKDPNLLAYLSPKQKVELEKSKKIPDEASTLLDLHGKFMNRKITHEEIKRETREEISITSIGGKNSNRLLTMIREEPSLVNDDKNYLYFEEKAPRLPRSVDNARLEAKDLSEWLNIARKRSMSESNLSNDIPENSLRNYFNMHQQPSRRSSLPQELFEKQMYYLQEKEREIQKQLEALEEEKRKLNAELSDSREFHAEDYHFSRKGDFAESKKRLSLPIAPTETFRQQMYEEYMDKFAEREERKQHKIIKVTSSKDLSQENEKANLKEIIHPIQLEDEFMSKVKQKQKEGKLEKVKSLEKERSLVCEEDRDPVLVIDGEKLKDATELPKHLLEFIDSEGIWSPGQKPEPSRGRNSQGDGDYDKSQDDIPPVWTPKSANSSPTSERKEFRAVNFQSPVLARKNRTKSESFGSECSSPTLPSPNLNYSSDTGTAPPVLDRRLPISRSTPASGFVDLSISPRLPKAQNPTITLLQKAREGQLPKGASYIEQEEKQLRPRNDRPPIANPGEVLYHIKNEYTSESETEKPRKMADLSARKFEGIGPVTKDGLPLILRSEVKDQNQSKWYKRMYDTIHKQKPHSDEYVTVRYKQKRAQYPYTSGYLSEPEPGAYDSDFADHKYQTLDRRRPDTQDRPEFATSTMPRNTTIRSSSSDILRNSRDYQKNQPGRIENYTTGHSSISDKEAKQWWDEVMDIFDGHLEHQKRVPPQPRSFINQALKESGYESDSTLVFRRKEDASLQLSPKDQKQAYKVIQKGGDVPLHGLRKPAPERPKDPEPPLPPPKGHHERNLEQESPRKYVENEVTIHYKTPVRQEIKEYLSEDELAYRQAEAMKKIYQEERRKKYLQELQDMNSRRHTDNFIPSQKSPIALNRYDNFEDLAPSIKLRPRSPEPRLCARALYNFVGQSARELTFRKGDIIYLRRQIDKNWYEGELNAMVGLLPSNYVEIIPFEGSKPTPRKAHEGQARAKYNFVAQSHLELSLGRGELVTITRRVDDNWYEGKIGGRKGIFPVNYVDVLIDPQTPPPPSSKPAAAPAAHSLLLNGSAGGKQSMGAHSYTPAPARAVDYRHAEPAQTQSGGRRNVPVGQALHIETQSEPIPFRALYKYNPQNDDELELLEGDTVYVLEKCDDGWYVGSSNRTGAFGTFPGNYVEKI